MANGLLRRLTNSAPTKSSDTPGEFGDIQVISMSDAGGRLDVLDDCECADFAWLWASDPQGRLIYISPGAAKATGRSINDLLARPLVDLFELDVGSPNGKSERPLKFQLGARSRLRNVTVRVTIGPGKTDGKQVWWSISANPKLDSAGNFLGYRGSAKDVTSEYERQLQDSRLAEYDSLTGLANRHRIKRVLDGTLAAFSAAKRSCALIMLDLDRFKHVNDSMGHQAGDELLKQVADRLVRIVGDKGEVSRLGGDEFQIILPDIDDRGALGDLADKLVQIVSQPYPIGEKRAIIGTSIGIAVAPFDGLDGDSLCHSSDLALYAAKNSGKGRFRFYSPDLQDVADERDKLMEDLREALANDLLDLHYQPVVRVDDNLVVGFEGLMRWEHPELGIVSPATFIPMAEESNLIIQLGEWALCRACRDAVAWPQSVKVAVNVSALQFANPGFPDVVAKALNGVGLEPSRLELELTESVFMGEDGFVDETFRTLKALGVKLALDDFGTGYSSLSYLRSAPFDRIKVDKSFVDSCTAKDQNSVKIIAAIIGLSNALQIETTVEGVEAFDQLELVRKHGARFIQGWIYSKALPQVQVLQRMSEGIFKIEPNGPDRYRAERRTVLKRIGLIYDDERMTGVMRDVSKTGARIEGMFGLHVGCEVVLDMGEGQLAVCHVTHVRDAEIGVEFETPLVNDGAGGLCTRYRISPYALAAAGMPLESLSKGSLPRGLRLAS